LGINGVNNEQNVALHSIFGDVNNYTTQQVSSEPDPNFGFYPWLSLAILGGTLITILDSILGDVNNYTTLIPINFIIGIS
jgi:hypothetical protein